MDPHAIDRLRSATEEIVARPRPAVAGSGREAASRAPHRGPQSAAASEAPAGRSSSASSGASPWDSALRLLGVRARSHAELRTRLLDKDFSPAQVEETLARLTEMGLIDDAEFARQWVESRHRNNGRGRIALRNELRGKGVDPAVAESALALVGDDDERDRAADLLDRKTASLSAADIADRADRDKHTRRLVAMLARRGYPANVAFDLVRSALDDLV
ncbi:regulatory protein RecX [Williamsia serinedens]|uniref:Regulatory protein RecX n=1 Tax=Williamsia serinedens TaxID=391736 RepID=A0ABT1GVP6_9NOCA|nr:regulatory protein RecX [Williamsia serinedens]MCP2159051.1 regulatory protein [Williamsia serinedens]